MTPSGKSVSLPCSWVSWPDAPEQLCALEGFVSRWPGMFSCRPEFPLHESPASEKQNSPRTQVFTLGVRITINEAYPFYFSIPFYQKFSFSFQKRNKSHFVLICCLKIPHATWFFFPSQGGLCVCVCV